MMDNDFAEDNEDDVINILQNVKVEMEHDDDDDDADDDDNDAGYEDNSSFVCVKEEEEEDDDDDNDDAGSKDNSSFVCLKVEKEEKEEEDDDDDDDDDDNDDDKESILSGKDGDSTQDSTSTSTHVPFEQVFIKEEHDSNSMDDTYTEPAVDSDPLSDSLPTEGIKILEGLDDYGRVVYRCVACNMPYLKRAALYMHMALEHKGLVYACTICREIFSCNENLQRHIETHLIDKLHGKVRTNSNASISYRNQALKRFTCNICHQVFWDVDAGMLTRHMVSHRSVMLSCKVCQFWCDSKDILKKHMQKHNGKEVHICSKCEQSFQTLNDLVFHKKSSSCCSPANSVHKCDRCGKEFESYCNLQKHKSVHGSNKYSCKICGKAYNYNTAIIKHIQKHDVDPEKVLEYRNELNPKESDTTSVSPQVGKSKSFKYRQQLNSEESESSKACKICGKIYRYRNALANHMRAEHKDHPIISNRSRRPFVCDFCGKRFINNAALLTHTTWHKKTPYPCKVCGKVFQFETVFYTHLRTHNMDPSDASKSRSQLPSAEDIVLCSESLRCDICGKKAATRDELLKHRNIHKPKKFRCKVCLKSFCSSTFLENHLLIHNAQ